MTYAMRALHAGSEAVIGWVKESASYPQWGASTYGTVPSVFAYGTFTELPTVVDYDGNGQVFGAGADESLGYNQSQRYSEITLPARIGSKALLASCLMGGTGFKGLDDVALYVGASDANSDGWAQVYRFCKCTRWQLEFREGGEIMFTPTFRSLGAPDAPASLLSPTNSDLANSGLSPLSWVNVQTLTIGGTDYRGDITGLTLTGDNNIKADNTRPAISGGDATPISRAAGALKPGQKRGNQGTINLNSRLDAALRNSGNFAGRWGSMIVTCNDTSIGGSQSFVATVAGCVGNQRTQQGGEATNQILHSAAFAFKGMTVA